MPFERGKALRQGEVEIPWNMKLGGDIRSRRQEDELNSEKCSTADTLGRLAIAATISQAQPDCGIWQEGLGGQVERSRGCGNDVTNPIMQSLENNSVVQTSVEVTESSLTCKSQYTQAVAKYKFN